MTLKPPPRNLSSIKLETETVAVSSLYRVSRFSSSEPFFGRAASNRFDDRSAVKSRRYGTCYCGFDLATAIAETVLHDEMPVKRYFLISYSDFASRYLVRFKGDKLVLAKLNGPPLKTLGGDGSISTVTPYRLPQLWSMAVHRNPQMVDGVFYTSRHLNDRDAVVVFDRARHKLIGSTFTSLPKARNVMPVAALLHISFQYP